MGLRGVASALVLGALTLGSAAQAQDRPGAPADPGVPRPRTQPQTWVTNDDYPVGAVRDQLSGTISFTLLVDDKGMPTKCDVNVSSGSPLLDETTCGLLLERARFHPALSPKGQPVAARWKSRFRWELPSMDEGNAFQPLISSRMVLDLHLGADGKVVRCEGSSIRSETELTFAKQDPCDFVRDREFSWITNGKPAHAIFSDEARVTGKEIAPEPARPGFETFSRDVIRFKVDAAGEAIECETIEKVGQLPAPQPCSKDHPVWSKPEVPPATVQISRSIIVNRDPAAQ